jgi:excisionase family DNA binding protein
MKRQRSTQKSQVEEIGDEIRWGDTVVSRRSYEMARQLLAVGRDEEIEPEEIAPPQEIREPVERRKPCLISVPPRELMTASEVAREAGAHYKTVRRWIQDGKLPATRTKTNRLRILRSSFLEFMGISGVKTR